MLLTNLPAQLTSFVGRARETEEIRRHVSASRLITLTGAGGCGKTRLALQVAGGMGSAFADGVWLVELASLCDPARTPDLVAQTLGVHPLPDQPLIELLLSFVRPRRMLLILDNCEHLISACAELAQTLLSVAPDLTLLATSREPLALAGEMLYQVSPLSLPPGMDSNHVEFARLPAFSPQDVSGSEAIQLFVERARAVLPDFALTPENTTAIVNICFRLDGIPLAIELASARVNVLTAQQIAQRLDDRFVFLISGQRTTPIPRHRTLRKAIDWSYDLLMVEEQVLLRRLAVFAAGFTLDTVEGICGGEGIADGGTLVRLSSLVNKSLIVATTLGRTEARYRLLESIRDYALEKLDESREAQRLHDRHLNLFLARAEEAAPRLFDAYQQLWLTWLEGEHDNLRAALTWSLESGRIEAGLRIAVAVTRFWEVRGHVQEGLVWFERLLAQADDGVALGVRVTAYTYASFMGMFLGHVAASTAYARTAVDLAKAVDETDPAILAFALGGLASGARAAGDFQTAYSILEPLIPICRASGPPILLGMTLLAQGTVAIELGAFAAAHELLEESLALAREAGDAFRVGHTLNSLGDLARCEQNDAAAQIAYEQSVALLAEIGTQHDLASILGNWAHACLGLGDVARAHTLFGDSMAIHQAQQNKPGMADALVGFAATAIAGGLPAVGARLLGAASAIGGQSGRSVWPARRSEYAHTLALARARLTEAEVQVQDAEGRAMTFEQATDYAQHLPLKLELASASNEKSDTLTEREREVAVQIARGKTNGEIADELVLSKRTVEKHISNLLSKLGMSNRAQIVRWALEHGLTNAAQ